MTLALSLYALAFTAAAARAWRDIHTNILVSQTTNIEVASMALLRQKLRRNAAMSIATMLSAVARRCLC